ncbi:MAG: VacJ family lipoprotein [Rickettsiales bacterium]|nr:VacJ family lipoprotein [Rickettsiales bacterium]
MYKKLINFVLLFCALSNLLFQDEAWSQITKVKNKSAIQQNSDDADFEIYNSENDQEVYDPLEKYNRKIFAFNDFLDRYFLEHIARGYRLYIPKPIRNSTRNFLTNLNAPISAFNSLLQGKSDNTLATISNFLINSTIGLGGLFEVAKSKGIKYNKEDFGQTLGSYGINSGAYLVVPFLGPSSTRDFSGFVTDQVINPASYNIFRIGGKTYLIGKNNLFILNSVRTIDSREGLLDITDDARKDSFDYYATLRSAYNQNRNFDIKN